TCLPSVLGVEEAMFPSPPIYRPMPSPSFRFHISFPSAPMHKRTKSLPSWLVRKMRFSQTIGVDPPWPGMASFQTTFFVSLHSAGRFVSLLTPSFVGPRHWGQLSATLGRLTTR